MELSSFRLLRGSCISFIMLGLRDSTGLLKDVVDSSPDSVCSFCIKWSDSTLVIISVAEMFVGVKAKFSPFFSRDTSASLRNQEDKLMTQLVLST